MDRMLLKVALLLSLVAMQYTAAENLFELRLFGLRKECLAIFGAYQTDGAGLIVWPCKDANHFKWYTVPSKQDPEYFNIFSKNVYNKCLTVNGNSVVNDATIVQWNCSDHPSQQWKFLSSEIAENVKQLVNKQSGKCVTFVGGIKEGAVTVQWDCIEAYNQQVYLNPVGGRQAEGITTPRSV